MNDIPFTVQSDMALGGRIAPYLTDEGADVTICEGHVPQSLPDATMRGVAFEVAGNRFLLNVPNGARYLVEHGARITYDRGGLSDREVALFLLGSAWGALCFQRGLLPLHASAVLEDGQVHAFTGPSGAGKSTLVAALADRGRAFFTDDVLIIDPTRGTDGRRCYTGQKDLKLWGDALHLTDAEKLGRVRDVPDFEKYFADPRRKSDASAGILASLTILRNEQARGGAGASIHRLTGGEAIQQLRNSVYRPRFAAEIWGRERLFRMLAELMADVRVQGFDRSFEKPQFGEGLAVINRWIGGAAKEAAGRDGTA